MSTDSQMDTKAGTAGDSCAARESYPYLPGIPFESRMELLYAEGFDVFYYEGGYKYFRVNGRNDYLLVPEGKEAPEGLSEDITILHAPCDHIYLAASSVMALFRAIDAIDAIRLSGTRSDDWYVEEAARAMEEGKILFAGKYSEPDYELLIREGCRIVIESTMILHTPKVQEMIENIGIPVFIDYSSYESHPLGRTEWVKLYGALTEHEKEAEAFFKGQTALLEQLEEIENTEKTVAFFYLNPQGSVVVRNADDYIPAMIEAAGGRYALKSLNFGESSRSSLTVTMEDFYALAVDADYLIYNGTIVSPVVTIEELLLKSPLLKDFKAVKEGNVWCTDRYLYQASDISAGLILDLRHMLTDGNESAMCFLKKVR